MLHSSFILFVNPERNFGQLQVGISSADHWWVACSHLWYPFLLTPALNSSALPPASQPLKVSDIVPGFNVSTWHHCVNTENISFCTKELLVSTTSMKLWLHHCHGLTPESKGEPNQPQPADQGKKISISAKPRKNRSAGWAMRVYTGKSDKPQSPSLASSAQSLWPGTRNNVLQECTGRLVKVQNVSSKKYQHGLAYISHSKYKITLHSPLKRHILSTAEVSDQVQKNIHKKSFLMQIFECTQAQNFLWGRKVDG